MKKIFFATLLLALPLLIQAQGQAKEKKKPYDTEIKEANRLIYREKKYAEALVHFKKAFELGDTNPNDYYNAACCASLTANLKDAAAYLIKATTLGYMDEEWTANDSDLAALKADKQWKEVRAAFQQGRDRVQAMFAKIKGKKPADLIPFRKADLWGYVDRSTLTVLVQPEFKELSFMRTCAKAVYRDNTILTIDPQGKLTAVSRKEDTVNKERAANKSDEVSYMEEEPQEPEVLSSAAGFKGFKLDANNNIIAVSDLYSRNDGNEGNVQDVFTVNGKPYAIAYKKETVGIIDQDGHALPGFDFVHKAINRNPYLSGPVAWFYVIDLAGKRGFISQKGETKLMGEVISTPFMSDDVMNYNIQHVYDGGKIPGNPWGVIDRVKMEWVIKPQPAMIERIHGIPANSCGPALGWGAAHDDSADVYFLLAAGDIAWYVDRDNKAYKPK